ncbi:MAG: histidine phosphatase family protein [Halobacteriales archaeon]|nr:histidine phosphatase family protein [Halobacteriales archaeon]
MRIVVLRHGETAWNDEGRMQGWAPVPLNETGREQATAAGRYLADEYEFDAIYASDLERTRETTERLATVLPATDIEYDAAFRERDVGIYQGLTYETVFDMYPRFALGKAAAEAANEVPESGESLVDMYERVTAGIDRIAARDHDTVLLVAHGGPIHLLHGYAKGMDVPDAMLAHEQDNCGINVFEIDEEIESVIENRTPWR